jgi:hypothetical protein
VPKSDISYSKRKRLKNQKSTQLGATVGTSLSYVAATDLEGSINSLSLTVVGIGSVLLVLFVLLAILFAKKAPKIKAPLFAGILLTVVGTTLTISGGTIYLNTQSYAGGPVHWHADYEVWVCGNELDLRDPHGVLSNKIGTPTLHEHNDKRIHLEGVPITPKDASLGKFMNVVGGEIGKSSLVFPLNDDNYFYTDQGKEDGDGNGAQAPELITPYIHTEAEGKVAKFLSGEKCGEETAEVQTFVYKFDKSTKTYKQTKIEDPANYVISGYSDVPPGDCIIMEFAPKMNRTSHLCKQYGIRDKDKCAAFGVPEKDRKICEDTEVQ